MSKRGFDVLLVRKSGPVRSLSMSSGWLYLLVVVLLVMVGGLGGNSYMVYRQQVQLAEISDDTRLLMLRAERLESLVQEQETRDILSQQASDDRAAPPAPKGKGKAVAPSNQEDADEPAGQVAPADEPHSSDRLSIKNIDQRLEGGELVVSFDLVNEREPRNPAMGYMALVVRGQRQGRAWFEAWPPMRLTAAGRPQNYHRGTPFSVQRYRRVLARVASLDDKKFESLEFVIYSRQGNLVMVKALPVNPSKGAARSQ